jgi:hypothetical protein
MRYPSHAVLEEMRAEGVSVQSYASGMNPNPRFWKYGWWVFWRESPGEGEEFLCPEHELSTAAAMTLLKQLEAEGQPCMLYNKRYPRRGSDFDPSAQRWKDEQWAPSLEDDPDEEWDGHK